MFETTGTIDKKFYDKYWKLLCSKIIRSSILFWVCYGVFSALTLIPVAAVTVALIMMIVLFVLTFISISRYKKISLKRVSETIGEASYLHTSHFEGDGVVVKNHALNSTSKIMYNKFVKFKKTDAVWFLFTKADLFVPVFVENFSAEEKEALLSFLRAHLTKVKKI